MKVIVELEANTSGKIETHVTSPGGKTITRRTPIKQPPGNH
jgi:hypothetical protein